MYYVEVLVAKGRWKKCCDGTGSPIPFDYESLARQYADVNCTTQPWRLAYHP